VSRDDPVLLADILSACLDIADFLRRRQSDDDLVAAAIRARIIAIGEAVKGLSSELTDSEPGVPWSDIARMRDLLAHRYFDTTDAVVLSTARRDVPALKVAVSRLLDESGHGTRSLG
jgi:uncharacterized protein with HEPN domain